MPLFFSFRSDVSPARRQRVLDEIRSWRSVDRAGPLEPEAPSESIERMCVLALRPAADPRQVIDRLSELPEIENASAPAERQLVF